MLRKNIHQLGVKNRFFIKPIESYLSKNYEIKKFDDNEPIAEISAKVAKKTFIKIRYENQIK